MRSSSSSPFCNFRAAAACGLVLLALGGSVAEGSNVPKSGTPNSFATAQDVDGTNGANYSTDFIDSVGDNLLNTSMRIPHVDVSGSGNGANGDYYSFTVAAGQRVIINDLSDNFGPELIVYLPDQVTVAGSNGNGSAVVRTTGVEFDATMAGTYYLLVANGGNPVSNSDTYDIAISVGNAATPVAVQGGVARVIAGGSSSGPQPVVGLLGSTGLPAASASGVVAYSAKLVSGAKGSGITVASGRQAAIVVQNLNYQDSGAIRYNNPIGGTIGSPGLIITAAPGVLAQEGNAAPGISDTAGSATFTAFADPVVNQIGAVAFRAAVKGGGATAETNTGIWETTTTFLLLAVRAGDPAPGTPTGTTFASFPSLVLNDVPGDLAFVATLRGKGVTASNQTGIWAYNLAGDLVLVARAGDKVSVGGVEKTISLLSIFTPPATTLGGGRGPGLRGILTYRASFTGTAEPTSAIFTWTP